MTSETEAHSLSENEATSKKLLADYLPTEGQTIPADESLNRFLEWVASQGIEPYSHQEDGLLELAAAGTLS